MLRKEKTTFDKLFYFSRLGKSALGCYDPSGGVIFADKALKCIQVIFI